MVTGSRCGSDRAPRWGVAAFVDDEGGYTSVTVAVALLVCLSLVFSLAQVQWVAARSADVQAVADACALSGARVVRAYATVAQVVDATVLSLGLCGLTVLGAGLVTGLVPGMGAAGVRVAEAGRAILADRTEIARSASRGLQALEGALPGAVAANGWATVRANGGDGVSYGGCAVAFPAESASVFDLAEDVAGEGVEERSRRAAEVSDRAKEELDAARAALEAGWRADCVDAPSCLCSRAASLAGLGGAQNPRHAHVEGWSFGVPLERARAYYAVRLAAEAPSGDGVVERADSARRRAFYGYALAEVRAGSFREAPDGTVEARLPRLAHDTEGTRATRLYDVDTWPCTDDGPTPRIHALADCPGATGAALAPATAAVAEAAGWEVCPECSMGVVALGRVAAASTSVPNGFEHYWRAVCDAAEAWERARNAAKAHDDELRSIAEEGAGLFEQALARLAVPRPRLCPPGAYGCVAVVARGGAEVPSGLSAPFAAAPSLPGGAAVAGATLAPDDGERSSVLARFFDGAAAGADGGVAGVLSGVTSLWGDLLEGYGDAHGAVADACGRLFAGLDAVGAGGVARWLGDRLTSVVAACGLEPADLRLRKPVLCNTQQILDKDGSADVATLRGWVQALPADGTAGEMLAALGRHGVELLGEQEVDLGELTVPGTPLKIPLKVRLKDLVGAGS